MHQHAERALHRRVRTTCWLALLGGCVSAAAFSARSVSQSPRRTTVRVQLAVHGGPHAGQHALTSAVIDCRIASRTGNQKDFSLELGFFRSDPRTKNPKRLNHVRLEVPNVATDSLFARFYLQATFGNPWDELGRTTHVVNTRTVNGRTFGSGSVRLRHADPATRLMIDARTRNGVRLTGTIDCGRIREI